MMDTGSKQHMSIAGRSSGVFPRARRSALKTLIFNSAFLALFSYVVFIVGFDLMQEEYRRGEFIYFGSIVLLPLSVLLALILIRTVLKRENAIVVGPNGLHDELSFNGPIAWSNIIGARQLKPDDDASSIAIRLKDRDAYFRYAWTKPLVARGDEVIIYGMGLSSSNKLIATITQRLNNVETQI